MEASDEWSTKSRYNCEVRSEVHQNEPWVDWGRILMSSVSWYGVRRVGKRQSTSCDGVQGFSLMTLALAAAAALRRVGIGIAPGLLESVCESKTFRVLG